MRTRTEAVLDDNIIKFQFLCKIPAIDITPCLEKDECFICRETYQINKWELGGTVHHPVALPCGHILGFQCLARWLLPSLSFDNSCALCRAQIIDFSAIRGQLSRALASSFARLEILAVVASNGISQTQKTQLLKAFEKSLCGEKTLCKPSKNSDRVMVVWEEMLNKMCNQSAASDNQNRVPLNERAAVRTRDGVLFIMPAWKVHILMGVLFFVVGLAFFMASLTWDFCTRPQKTLLAFFGAGLHTCLAGTVFLIFGTQWEVASVICGTVFGLSLTTMLWF